MNDAQRLADRYVAVWNEADPDRRRNAIAALWTPDGEHFVDVREARGHDALYARVTGSFEKNVRGGGHRFRAVNDARALRNAVTFRWEMLKADTGAVVAHGFEFLIVDAAARIIVDYQFFLGPVAASA